jgi:2,3-dihydro-2,3-dihydroxybenzoate dehydrogenase
MSTGANPGALSSGLRPGHVTVVTGSRRGIGLACARAFLAAGGRVALADLDEEDLREAQRGLDPEGKVTSIHRVDVSEPSSVARMLDEAIATHGGLDAIVNAAATLRQAPATELTLEDWDLTFGVNARGSFIVATEAARRFIEHGTPGRIVLFGSIIARVVRPDSIAYCASKAAVGQISRCLAFELAKHGINVNVVSPGSTATEMLIDGQLNRDPVAIQGVIDGDATKWRLGIPLGRLAEPSDPAAAALFLTTEASRQITGTEIVVDGGQTVV